MLSFLRNAIEFRYKQQKEFQKKNSAKISGDKKNELVKLCLLEPSQDFALNKKGKITFLRASGLLNRLNLIFNCFFQSHALYVIAKTRISLRIFSYKFVDEDKM